MVPERIFFLLSQGVDSQNRYLPCPSSVALLAEKTKAKNPLSWAHNGSGWDGGRHGRPLEQRVFEGLFALRLRASGKTFSEIAGEIVRSRGEKKSMSRTRASNIWNEGAMLLGARCYGDYDVSDEIIVRLSAFEADRIFRERNREAFDGMKEARSR
jgi:hypothetical protein